MDFTIISHVKKNEFTPTDEWAVQSNEEHNQGVANWAGRLLENLIVLIGEGHRTTS